MSNITPENLSALLPLVSRVHQPALQQAINFMQNPTQQTAEAVAAVMGELFEIKQNMRNRDEKIKQLDDVIKFAVRATESFPTTQHFFDVKPARHVGKIENSAEMLRRLLKIFVNPLDFSSCVEFNFNALRDLMGDNFIKENSDIISERDCESAVFLQKGVVK
jgi:hypothetical protein